MIQNVYISASDGMRNLTGTYGAQLTELLFRGTQNDHASPSADIANIPGFPSLHLDSKMRRCGNALAFEKGQLLRYADEVSTTYLYANWSWASPARVADLPSNGSDTANVLKNGCRRPRPSQLSKQETTLDFYRFMEARVNSLYIIAPEILVAIMENSGLFIVPGQQYPARLVEDYYYEGVDCLTVPRELLQGLVADKSLLTKFDLDPKSFGAFHEQASFEFALGFEDSVVSPELFHLGLDIYYLTTRYWCNRVAKLVRRGVRYQKRRAGQLMRRHLSLFDDRRKPLVEFIPF